MCATVGIKPRRRTVGRRRTVCNVQVLWSHRLEYFENNFTAEYIGLCACWPQHGRSGAKGTPPKLRWNRGGVRSTYVKAAKSPHQGYYDVLIGSRIRAFDWHQYRWPWVALNGRNATLAEINNFHHHHHHIKFVTESTIKISTKIDSYTDSWKAYARSFQKYKVCEDMYRL